MNTLHARLKPERLTEIVDIGANQIDGNLSYKKIPESGRWQVTGFEPQEETLSELLRKRP